MNVTNSAILQSQNIASLLAALGFGSIIGGVIVNWFKNKIEQNSENKRRLRELKEKQYKDFLNNLMGFFEGYDNKQQRKQFLWDIYANAPVYASDDVIKLAYKFIKSFHIEENRSQKERDKIYAELVIAIRKELSKIQGEPETKLKAEDIIISRLAEK